MSHNVDKIRNITGQCLCGGVTIHVGALSKEVGACHCSMCRKWSAGPYMAVDGGVDVRFTGGQLISRYQSSEWAERGFCSCCGTLLFYCFKETSHYMFSVELFDNPSNFSFTHQIFIDEKPDYYQFSNDTHNMTAEETIAAFSEQN